MVSASARLDVPARRAGSTRHRGAVLAAVAVGGAVGACARYGATLWWPGGAGAFPWVTFGVNVTGCGAIGVLMTVIAQLRSVHPLVRPFVGTGVLGGFTTFSTYAVDVERLLRDGHAGTGVAYLVLTAAAALAATWIGALATSLATRRRA